MSARTGGRHLPATSKPRTVSFAIEARATGSTRVRLRGSWDASAERRCREALNRLVAERFFEFPSRVRGFFCRGLEAQEIFDLLRTAPGAGNGGGRVRPATKCQ